MEEDDGPALALVEVGQPQPVELAVARLQREAGQAVEALVRRAEGVHQRWESAVNDPIGSHRKRPGGMQMAVAQTVLSDERRSVLEALCDTFIPSVDVDGDPIELEFMARAASDLGVAAQIVDLLAQAMLPEEIEAVGGLLDALGAEGSSMRRSTREPRSFTASATRTPRPSTDYISSRR